MQEIVTRHECQRTHQILNGKMDKLSEEINNLRLEVAMLPEKLAKEFDKRYASKLTEKIVYGAAGIILAAFVYYLIKYQ